VFIELIFTILSCFAEVIRHESYSSNADVYSFAIVLWQLITREVPFATMTPIQAAFSVAEGRRPEIPPSCPPRLREIIEACWDQDSHKRPSFTYVAMQLADYARMAFSPGNVGSQTLQIANEMLANVEGNSTVNVDFSTPVAADFSNTWFGGGLSTSFEHQSSTSNVGLEIE
jgi:serine/threonine protein kinase